MGNWTASDYPPFSPPVSPAPAPPRSPQYASAFYGPFRDALASAPKAASAGRVVPPNKKTYQQDPANYREVGRGSGRERGGKGRGSEGRECERRLCSRR